jgi:hypothetical protein
MKKKKAPTLMWWSCALPIIFSYSLTKKFLRAVSAGILDAIAVLQTFFGQTKVNRGIYRTVQNAESPGIHEHPRYSLSSFFEVWEGEGNELSVAIQA